MIDRKNIKQYIGQSLYWLDIDPSGRPQAILRGGVLTDVCRGQLEFNEDGDYKMFDELKGLTTEMHSEWRD